MENKVKRIAVVTGSRAEYGNIRKVLDLIEKSKKLKLLLYVTGIHLLEKFGHTIDIIRRDSFKIRSIIPMYPSNKSLNPEILGNSIGLAIQGFTKIFVKDKPDLLVVPGDRLEVFCAVIAAAAFNIPIAHIQGGDSSDSSQIDEFIRHSISKFAHIHFPACKSSLERLIKMGEEDWRIYNVGAVSIDQIYDNDLLDKELIFKKLSLNPHEITILCIFHPYIPEAEDAGNQMDIILNILKEMDYQTIILYPNNDLGSEKIIDVIQKYSKINKFHTFINLIRQDYLSLLKNIDLVIGNSSSGIVESPSFKLPTINLGFRNKKRETGQNVIHCKIEPIQIRKAIKKALSEDFKNFCQNTENPYGNGKASEKVVKILDELRIDKNFLLKKISY